MMSMFRTVLPFVFLLLFFLLLLAFAVFFLIPADGSSSIKLPIQSSSSCDEGAQEPCSVNLCGGYKKCQDGKWSRCIIEQVCTPNSRANCVEFSCSVGYKLCNECGTGYNECVYYDRPSRNISQSS